MLLEAQPWRLITVDLSSGERRVVSDASTGQGPALVDPIDAAIQTRSSLAYVLDAGAEAVVVVDLTSGVRHILSDATHGSGPSIGAARGFALHRSEDFGIVLREDSLLRVRLTNGDREVQPIGSGPGIDFSRATSVTVAGSRQLAQAQTTQAVPFSVWLALAEAGQSNEPRFAEGGVLIQVDPVAQRHARWFEGAFRQPVKISGSEFFAMFLVADAADGQVVPVNIPGAAAPGAGLGPAIEAAVAVALHSGTEIALVADSGRFAVLARHTRSGDRVVLSR